MSPSARTPVRVRAGLRLSPGDGIRLATDLYLPGDATRHPVVLLRTYLGKSRHLGEALGWARAGFACVVQDVRGRYDSDGAWRPYGHEIRDGAATVAWIAEQPWCDGRICPTGGSYGAYTAWAAAGAGTAAVIAAVPAMHPVNFDGGALKLLNHVYWWTTHGDSRTERTGLAEAMLNAEPDLLRHLPVDDLPGRLWADLPGFASALRADAPSPPIGGDHLGALSCPTLHLGGWHDPFVAESLRQWRAAGARLAPRPARGLLIGPWTHELKSGETATYGERRYGPASRRPLGPLEVRWLRAALGLGDEAPEPPVRLYFGGAERWWEGNDWPATGRRSFFPGAAGLLAETPDLSAAADGFRSDPNDPFPSRSGPVDQRDLHARTDAVRWTSPPLSRPLALCGAPRVEIEGESTAPSCDWLARLCEVLPDGRSLYLAGALIESRVEPGGRHRVAIELSPLAHRLPAGHRLLLEIAGSHFPEHARNPQTGAPRTTAAVLRPARQTVFRSGTRLEIPEAPDEALRDDPSTNARREPR